VSRIGRVNHKGRVLVLARSWVDVGPRGAIVRGPIDSVSAVKVEDKAGALEPNEGHLSGARASTRASSSELSPTSCDSITPKTTTSHSGNDN
jgi:hypothetical protein